MDALAEAKAFIKENEACDATEYEQHKRDLEDIVDAILHATADLESDGSEEEGIMEDEPDGENEEEDE